mgnify:CR=1 FL=1
MSFTGDSKQQISLKKLVGKAHTKNEAEFFNEAKSSGLTISSQTIFGESIPESPSSASLYDNTDDIVEYLRLPLDNLPESLQDGSYHGFSAKLPPDYETSSTFSKSGEGNFVNNKNIFETKGDIQLVPPSFGNVYEVKLYYGGDVNTKGSGTRIPVLDNRNWYFDYFNGVLFQQTPPGTGDHPENPDFIEVFVYIGKKSIEVNNSSLSSLWEVDPLDSNNLRATSILDGDTGLFSLDFNMTLDNDNIVNTIKYTTTNRQDARDLHFEFDDNGNITTKE